MLLLGSKKANKKVRCFFGRRNFGGTGICEDSWRLRRDAVCDCVELLR